MKSASLTSFDPGVNEPDRWARALLAAFLSDVDALVIDGVFAVTQRCALARRLSVIGDPGSRLVWTTPGAAGLWVKRGADESRFSRVELVGPDRTKESDDGLRIEANAVSVDDGSLVREWSGAGIAAVGDVNHGTDANSVRLTDVTAILCGHSASAYGGGFYFDGGDSSAGLMVGCKAYDCRRGFFDSSFLGNTFVGCHAEGCNDRFTKAPNAPTIGYGYLTDDRNARSLFTGCYAESDSESDVRYPSLVVGGRVANRGDGMVVNGSRITPYVGAGGAPYVDVAGRRVAVSAYLGTTDVPGTALMLEAKDPDTGIPLQQQHRLVYGGHPSLPDVWSLRYANAPSLDVLRFRGPLLSFPNGYDNAGMREIVADGIASIYVPPGVTINVGDRLTVRVAHAGQPSAYRCTSIDAQGVPVWSVETRMEP